MLFVTAPRNYSLTIQTDVTEHVQGSHGRYVPRELEELFEARFSQGCVMTPNERRAANILINSRNPHLRGAQPYMEVGVVDSAESDGGKVFQASDETFQISGFRTDDPRQCPPQFKEKAEERLLDPSLGFGTDWFLVEHAGVPKPWPSYDATHHNEVIGMVEKLGLDAQLVIEYEQATKNRASVVEKLEALVSAQAEKRFEERPLEVTI